MDWRNNDNNNNTKNKEEKINSDYKQNSTYKPKPKYNNYKINSKFNEKKINGISNSKYLENSKSRTIIDTKKFKSHEEIDKILNSNLYIPVNKKLELEKLRNKFKNEYEKKNPNILNEEMFPSLNSKSKNVEKNQTCWGKKLPDQIYDTSVQFQKNKQETSNKLENNVNSELSDDDDDNYDSFEEDYYNDFNEDDDYQDEGF